MKVYRKAWFCLLLVIVVIQFIQPKKNISPQLGANDISKVYAIPSGIHQTFTQKCYDCHSNNTRYPWYFNIQPVGWWLAAHVYEGKEHLNFSEFKQYQSTKVREKLEDIAEVVEDRSMPLKPFVLLHPESKLTVEDEKSITVWIQSLLREKGQL
jgi:hypothetical protein